MDYRKAIEFLRKGGGELLDNSSAIVRRKAPLIGEVVEEDIKRLPPGMGLPDIETVATHLDDVNPNILSKAPASTLAQTAESLQGSIDDVLTPGISKRNIALGLGAGGAGVLALNQLTGDEDQNQQVIPAKTLDTSVPVDILANADRQQKTKKSESSSIKKSEPAEEIDLPLGLGVSAPEDDFEARLKAAQERDASDQLLFGLLKASQMGGAALAGSKADTDFADTRLADKNRYSDLLGKEEKLKSEHNKELDEKVLRDPNSAISQQARDIARKVGIRVADGVTAKQLADAGLPIGNLFSQKQAQEARKEEASLRRSELSERSAERKERQDIQNQFKDQAAVDKMVTNLRNSDDFKGYQQAKAAKVALDNALATGDKTAIGSGFMLYGKIAQGDNSVLRESDMKNLAGTFNYSSPSEMIAKLTAKAKGASFTDQELKQMKQITEVIERTKARQVQQQLAPIAKRFESKQLDPAESIDPAILREVSDVGALDLPKEASLTTINKGAAPSSAPVTIRNKATGTVKTLDAARAAKYLSDPNFERVQ